MNTATACTESRVMDSAPVNRIPEEPLPGPGIDADLTIDGAMTIPRARQLKGELLGMLGPKRRLGLDLSAVTDIDTAGIQLLLMAAIALRALGGDLRLIQPSDAVTRTLTLLGLADQFALSPATVVASTQQDRLP